MDIREASNKDIPAIVELLKQSLGETLMPKSEEYWKWKHMENPFGPSPVVLCWEGSTLVGVRAFMRWEWVYDGQCYRSVRAVDTASHPEFQGRGIFKKLTLSLVDYCKNNGDHFVFNTPNDQSRPGYLKMGWEEAGKLPIAISIRRPLNILRGLAGHRSAFQVEQNELNYYLHHPELESLIDEQNGNAKTMRTKVSRKYLLWRYSNVPVAQYVGVGEEVNGMLTAVIIGRLKQTRLGRELRITDCFFRGNSNHRKLSGKLAEKKKDWAIDYTTISGVIQVPRGVLGGLAVKPPVGPIVTIRSLCLENLNILRNFNHWSPSIGDLELF